MSAFIFPAFALLAILSILLPIIAIVSVIRNKSLEQNTALIWILVILLFPVVGSLIYFIKAPNRRAL